MTAGGQGVDNPAPIVDGFRPRGRPSDCERPSTHESHDDEAGVAPPILRVFSQPNTEGAIMTLPPDVVTRPCACGRSVTASRTAPYDGVSHHNRTPEHRAWWKDQREAWGEE